MRALRALLAVLFLGVGLAIGALNPQSVAIDLGFSILHASLGVALLLTLLAGDHAGGLVLAASTLLPRRGRLPRDP